MSLNHSPQIVTNGLVYYHDMGNTQKSWKGAPTTNLIYTTPYGLGVYAYASGPVQTNSIIGANFSPRTVNRYTITQSVNFARAKIIPNITINTTYTFSFKVKYNGTNTSITSSLFYADASKGSPEGTGNDNTINSSSIAATPLANGWWYVNYTFNISACPTGKAILCYGITTGSDATFVGNTFDIYDEQFEIQNFASPFVAGTRSNTQALLDLTGNNTITANSLTYASDGTFSFNGSSNYINATMPTPFNMYCLDIWYYNNNAIPNNDTAIGGPSTYQTMVQFNGAYPTGVNLGGWSGQLTNEAIQIWSSTTSPYNVTYNRDYVPVGWHNTVFNWNGTQYDIWTDGVKTTTYATSGYSATLVNISSLQIGYSSPGYYYNGKIPVVKCYNRQLSDSEIKQNFNALRGRFGI